jgi:hypothetical protein
MAFLSSLLRELPPPTPPFTSNFPNSHSKPQHPTTYQCISFPHIHLLFHSKKQMITLLSLFLSLHLSLMILQSSHVCLPNVSQTDFVCVWLQSVTNINKVTSVSKHNKMLVYKWQRHLWYLEISDGKLHTLGASLAESRWP